jgi:hypothetical protein
LERGTGTWAAHCFNLTVFDIESYPYLWVVGQFGVSEINYLTEPSAVAPDARVKLRTKQVAHHPRSFSGC